jgi:hypothetical protein
VAGDELDAAVLKSLPDHSCVVSRDRWLALDAFGPVHRSGGHLGPLSQLARGPSEQLSRGPNLSACDHPSFPSSCFAMSFGVKKLLVEFELLSQPLDFRLRAADDQPAELQKTPLPARQLLGAAREFRRASRGWVVSEQQESAASRMALTRAWRAAGVRLLQEGYSSAEVTETMLSVALASWSGLRDGKDAARQLRTIADQLENGAEGHAIEAPSSRAA